MLIEGRRKNAGVMCCIWAVVPLTTSLLLSYGVYWGDETGLIVVLITSGVVHLAGVVVYLGFYEALAGFSTASDEEMEQFNTDEVTAFMGVSLSLVSMVLFYAFLLAVKFAGNLAGTLSMAAITFVAVVAMSIYVGISQRFKNSKEHASRK